jgi:hypothetical protein
MKSIYAAKKWLVLLFLVPGFIATAQSPTVVTNGICTGVIANFNTNDGGCNSPSIYGSIFDSSFYYNAPRGYWTDYLPPSRVSAPGAPRVMDIITPPYINPNPTGTFNVGFYYIVNNPAVDRFQVRIISVTTTPQGTVTNVVATSGLQFFSTWSTPVVYVDNGPNTTALLNGFQGNICIRLIDPDIVNGPNTTFRVEVAYLVNEPFFAVFDNLSIGPANIPLPVDFIGLVANKSNSSTVDLRWDVSQELNVRQYEIERSSDGASFSSVGSVPAKGKSIYSFSNSNAPSSTLFYRVKSVDIDGRFKYSGIIKLPGNSSNSFSNQMMIYPVPAQDEIMVDHQRLTAKAKMTIISSDGQVLKVVIPTEGSSHTPVNISTLKPGMYYLKLEDGTGDVQTVKLIKN